MAVFSLALVRVLVLTMESSFTALILDDEDGDDLDLKTAAMEVQPGTNHLAVVGSVLINKIVNFGVMRNTLLNLWHPDKGLYMQDFGQNRFLIQFFHVVDLRRVLDGSPWTFNNHLVLFHQLQPGNDPFTVQFHHALFWIQIHNVSMGHVAAEAGRLLGDFVGKFVSYDAAINYGLWRNYM